MSEIEKLFDVPDQWTWATFEEIGVWSGGGTPSKRKSVYWDGEIPWVSPKDMKTLTIQDTEDHVTPTAVQESSAKYIPSGSILFVTRSGILQHTLPTAIANADVTVNQDLKALTPVPSIDSKFVLYYTIAANRHILHTCSKSGTTVQSIESSKLYQYPIPLPSITEQRRIVAKIEELFSNLDAGMADLQTAQRLLERYRLSVLQAAVEGRLTADWRRTHDVEAADTLLERILTERRKQWEEHYRWSRYDSKGKEPPSGWKSKYNGVEEPKLPETESRLPESWTWVSADQIGRVETGSTPKTSVDEYYGGKYPFYRPGDLETGINTRSAERTLTEEGLAEARPLPEESILITCIGATIGKTGLIRVKGASNQQINAIIPVPSVVPEYIFYVAKSPFFQALIKTRASATTMPILNKGRTKMLPIPLPPVAEQKEVVSEVERLLSVADNATQTVDRELKRADQLRNSIVKEAFQGSLLFSSDCSGLSLEELSIEREELQRLLQNERNALKKETESTSLESHVDQMNLFRNSDSISPDARPREINGTRLGNIILEAGQPLTPKELFELSSIEEIDKFYSLLKKEVEAGIISERVPNSNTRILDITDEN